MNISFYIIIVWISIIFVNFGIDVDKLILMIVVIMIGVLVGIFIVVLIIDYFFCRLFGFILFIIIVVLGYIYLI